ncbi:ladderlectin-like [Morone saxatilis]|uniref:ladderlectin-like n=1 Tax=Morone saxatilis TaxID=34816 RepID=UPI0015E1D9DF|nr:ladderlectin-like [Morone saxatilis]
MKALLLLSVLLCGALTATAAAVGTAETVPQKLQEDNQISEAENEAGAFVPEGRFFACPTGWVRYKSSCYQLVSSSRSWSSAAAHCASLGASLASVHDQFDYSFLQELTRRAGHTVSWMGGFYFQGWRWVDQSSFSYTYWSTVNSANSYPCVYLRVTGGWSNQACSTTWPSICMKRTDTC